jgi:hypothetical protein
MAIPPDLAAAEAFVLSTGRLIDRHRFAVLFHAAEPNRVVSALAAYQNPDGGFGHALEPDLRGPESEPMPTWAALAILDEIGRFDDAMVVAACDYLGSIATAEGGVPFVLAAARAYPHAPWWESDDEPAASMNPTAAIAAILHKRGLNHPWLGRATDFSWRAIESETETSPTTRGPSFRSSIRFRIGAEPSRRSSGSDGCCSMTVMWPSSLTPRARCISHSTSRLVPTHWLASCFPTSSSSDTWTPSRHNSSLTEDGRSTGWYGRRRLVLNGARGRPSRRSRSCAPTAG